MIISESNITYKQSRYKHNFGDSPSSDDFESGKEIYYELLHRF